jgi:hypothetical protein
MSSLNPNEEPQGFDIYRYRTALTLGGAVTAIVGELCVGGNAEHAGDTLVYLGGIASGVGLAQFFRRQE